MHHVTPAHLQRSPAALGPLCTQVSIPPAPPPHYILCSFGLGGCLLAGALQLPAAVDRARRSQPQWLHAVHLGGLAA